MLKKLILFIFSILILYLMIHLIKYNYIYRTYSKYHQNNIYYKIENIEKKINHLIDYSRINESIRLYKNSNYKLTQIKKELKIVHNEITLVKKELYEDKNNNKDDYHYMFII
jgi:cell shape-determining protein MreC